jgi:hypothetical protein
MTNQTTWTLGLLACLSLFTAGCWSRITGRPTVYPVNGQVFINGQPAVNARVQFHAVSDPELDRLRPHAIVQTDGSFRLTTFKAEDGAPAGTYAVTVTWPSPPKRRFDSEGPDRLQGRYADPRRAVRQVEVRQGANELERMDLR